MSITLNPGRGLFAMNFLLCTGERVPAPPLEIDREPFLWVLLLANGGEGAAAVVVARLAKVIVKLVDGPVLNHSSDISDGLLKPTINFPLGSVGDMLSVIVSGFKD